MKLKLTKEILKALKLTDEQVKELDNEFDIPNVVNESDLTSAKGDLTKATDKLNLFGNNTPETIKANNTELEALKKDSSSDDLKLENAKFKSTIETLKGEKETAVKENTGLKLFKKETKILGDVRSQAKKIGVKAAFMNDVEFMARNLFDLSGEDAVTKQNVGITPGMSVEKWLDEETKSTRPYWLEDSKGGDSTGGNLPTGKTGLEAKQKRYNEILDKKEMSPNDKVEAFKLAKEMKELQNKK